MEIKELLINIKNNSQNNKYDMTLILKQLQNIYIERVFGKFFSKKETIDILNEQKNFFNQYKKYDTRRENLGNFIDKWQDKDNHFLKTGSTIFIINLVVLHLFFNENLGIGFVYSFLSSGFSCFIFALVFLGADIFLENQIKKIEKKFSNKYHSYIKNNYKEVYSKISLDLINEIEAVDDLVLNQFKKDLKEHIIKYTHTIQDEKKLSAEDLYIINQVENKIFKEKTKPIDNKILKKEKKESVELLKKEENENLDINNMLKNLQTKFEDKIL